MDSPARAQFALGQRKPVRAGQNTCGMRPNNRRGRGFPKHQHHALVLEWLFVAATPHQDFFDGLRK